MDSVLAYIHTVGVFVLFIQIILSKLCFVKEQSDGKKHAMIDNRQIIHCSVCCEQLKLSFL